MNIEEQLIECLTTNKAFELYLNEVPDYSIEDVIQLRYCMLTDHFHFIRLRIDDNNNSVRGYIPDKSKYKYLDNFNPWESISWWKYEDSCILLSLIMGEKITDPYYHEFSEETCNIISELLIKYDIINDDIWNLYRYSNVEERNPYTSEKFINIVSPKVKSARNT